MSVRRKNQYELGAVVFRKYTIDLTLSCLHFFFTAVTGLPEARPDHAGKLTVKREAME